MKEVISKILFAIKILLFIGFKQMFELKSEYRKLKYKESCNERRANLVFSAVFMFAINLSLLYILYKLVI